MNQDFKMNVWHKGKKIYTECLIEDGVIYAWLNNDLEPIFKCRICGEYYTEDGFCKNRTNKNGLNPWCKKCTNEYNKERRAKKSASPAVEETPVVEKSENPVETSIENIWADFKEKLNEALSSKSNVSESDISRLSDRIDELESENQGLRESNEKLNKEILAPITEDDLNDNVVVAYLKKNEVPLRILIEAITARDNGIEITVFDSNTGLTRTIKYETPNAA